jgi:hypothetical protein
MTTASRQEIDEFLRREYPVKVTEVEPIEFKAWPKISRLYRPVTITEKIDGTNAAVGIREVPFEQASTSRTGRPVYRTEDGDNKCYLVYAQSRSRIIAPGNDNHGFARWVYENASTLVTDLGKGLHFGEWWGQGIQRGYGLTEKRLSLFNTGVWEAKRADFTTPQLDVVPIVSEVEVFSTLAVHAALENLRTFGSFAELGFMQPEGVVIFHHASRQMFKVTLENDAGMWRARYLDADWGLTAWSSSGSLESYENDH